VALLFIAPFARATPARVHETDTVDGAGVAATTATNLWQTQARRSDASDQRVAALVVDLLYNTSATNPQQAVDNKLWICCGFVVQQIHNKSQLWSLRLNKLQWADEWVHLDYFSWVLPVSCTWFIAIRLMGQATGAHAHAKMSPVSPERQCALQPMYHRWWIAKQYDTMSNLV